MLWKIESSRLHILGAIHLSDTPVDLDSAALQALDAAKTIAFETNWDAPGISREVAFRPGTGSLK